MLIVMAGLPGTGKSTLARALAAPLGAAILDKDGVRAAIFPPGTVDYSREQDDLCIDVILRVAAYLFRRDPKRAIILDGRTFSRRSQVATVQEAARSMEVKAQFLLCTCRETTALRRLARDQARGDHPAANRDAALYHRVRARFEPLTCPHLVVDTDQPVVVCVAQALAYLVA
jgi:adenylylsulfate kinase